MLNEDQVAQKQYFKKYLLYIYFHKVNTFLGDAAFIEDTPLLFFCISCNSSSAMDCILGEETS